MMKRILASLSLVLIIAFLLLASMKVSADVGTSGVPYKTYTEYGNGYELTPTAYIPLQKLTNASISSPEDIYIDDTYIYIANTGAKNVLVFDKQFNPVKEIGKGTLDTPTGLFVKNRLIYVCDRIKEKVFIFNLDNELIKEIKRPEEALFGSNANFVPEKVVVDDRLNIYVTGSGATNGVIQMNENGKFLGYFAVNKTSSSFLMKISELLKIESLYAKNLPSAPTNLGIDDKGLVYTVTETDSRQVKKFDFASNIMLSASPREGENVRDVFIDSYDNIYYVTSKGTIYEYDKFGNLLFSFGGLDTGDQRLGLLVNPTGICVDDEGNIYCLDKNYNSVEVYGKTSFALLLDDAIRSYDRGDLDTAKQLFEEVLIHNESFTLANRNLGKIHLKEGNYDLAMEYFKAARYKEGYSEAFWEVRNNWMVKNLGTLFIILIAFIILCILFKKLVYNKFLKEKAHKLDERLMNIRVLRELKLIFKFNAHPLNTYYDIQRRNASSILTASIIYALMFVFTILGLVQTSFLFEVVRPNHINILRELAISLGLPLLFVVSNYLMSALSEGEGRFKDIFIATAYAITPLLLIKLPLAWLTNVLTYNETFIITIINVVAYTYTGFLLFFMVKDIHNFTVGKTIKNILLTVFTMALIVVLIFIIYILMYQLFEFIIEIIKEAVIRAT